MTIPQRKPGISWEADSLYHHCLLCSGMPGYHPVSIYNITMGTKRQAGAWGTLSLVGCPVRLVLGDSMLDSSAVFLKKKKKKKKKKKHPWYYFIKGRPTSQLFGVLKKCDQI